MTTLQSLTGKSAKSQPTGQVVILMVNNALKVAQQPVKTISYRPNLTRNAHTSCKICDILAVQCTLANAGLD